MKILLTAKTEISVDGYYNIFVEKTEEIETANANEVNEKCALIFEEAAKVSRTMANMATLFEPN